MFQAFLSVLVFLFLLVILCIQEILYRPQKKKVRSKEQLT